MRLNACSISASGAVSLRFVQYAFPSGVFAEIWIIEPSIRAFWTAAWKKRGSFGIIPEGFQQFAGAVPAETGNGHKKPSLRIIMCLAKPCRTAC